MKVEASGVEVQQTTVAIDSDPTCHKKLILMHAHSQGSSGERKQGIRTRAGSAIVVADA